MRSILPIQPGEVEVDGLYLLGHYHGLYSGPCGHLEMVDGVPVEGPVEGALIIHGGLENICEVFAALPDHHLEWDGEAWQCLSDAKPIKPSSAVAPVEAEPKTSRRRRRRKGRQ